jgi:citrate synthase
VTTSARQYSTAFESELKSKFAEALPKEQERLKAIKKEHGTKDIHPVTVNMAIGGMRGITGMLYETSLLDPEEGIQFRGYSIPQVKVRSVTDARWRERRSSKQGLEPITTGLLQRHPGA